MKKKSILLLYSIPPPFFPDGTPDKIGYDSVISRLHAVYEALQHLGYPVQTLEAKGDLNSLIQEILSARVDLIFNLCEEFCELTRFEMNLAALLELLNVPFTGSSALILGLSQDKGKTKAILAHYGIPTPAYRISPPGKRSFGRNWHFP
jgi:D-alanine-D-alanine ligase